MNEIPANLLFNEGWMSYKLVDLSHVEYSINLSPEQILSIDAHLFAEYQQLAVQESVQRVGNKPAVTLSGGIDSQVMVHSFVSAGVDFSPVIFDFDGKNSHDTNVALEFCELMKLKPTIINLNVGWFLNREGVQFGLKHGLRSPQFTCHAKLCQHLASAGFSGAVFGGNAAYRSERREHVNAGWIYHSTAAQLLDLVTFGESIGWPIIGSFCSWSWKMCLSLSALSVEGVGDVAERYQQKVAAYRAFGVPIIPQAQKYTGFEVIKAEVDSMDKPGYFELKFRAPLYSKTPDQNIPSLKLTTAQETALNELSRRLNS